MIPYELTFEQRPEYLIARVTAADIDNDTALAYLRKISDKCREMTVQRVLVFRHIPKMLDSGSLYFTTSAFRDMMLGIKVAFLNPNPEIREDFSFAINVATNRGGNFEVFENEAEAESWLLK